MSFVSKLRPSTLVYSALAALLLLSSTAYAEPLRVGLTTTQGDIVIELDPDRAPQTVNNFLQYVDDGFYNNTLFHRVIEGFMIQGGGFGTDYQRKTTRPPVSNEAYNGLRNRRYTIAMARTTAPHSATAQFFINSEDNGNLDHTDTSQRGWGYTVFGKVVEGEAVVDTISRTRTGSGGPFSRDVPVEPIVILNAFRLDAEPVAADDAKNLTNGSTKTEDASSTANAEDAPAQPVEQN